MRFRSKRLQLLLVSCGSRLLAKIAAVGAERSYIPNTAESSTMFDPSKTKSDKAKKVQKKKIIAELVDWCKTIVPIQLREGSFGKSQASFCYARQKVFY